MKAVRFHEYGAAKYILVRADTVVAIPAAMSYEQAASTQTTFATAWHCLVTRARVRAGETVLISAAGSGVGSSGIQVAQGRSSRSCSTWPTRPRRTG